MEEQLTDVDLRALLAKNEAKAEYEAVDFGEFSIPTYEEWKQACINLLKGAPFDKKMYTKTYEDITFAPIYTREEMTELLPKKEFPGLGDCLRGARPNGYLQQAWLISQPCDLTQPEANNTLLRHEVDKGSTAYNILFDTPTRLGQTLNEKSEGIGVDGCNVASLEDLHQLLQDLDLKKYPLYAFLGYSPLPMTALLAAVCKSNAYDLRQIHGVFGADPIGTLVKQGTLPTDLANIYDEMAAAAAWAAENTAGLRTIVIDSSGYSDGGANDVQEMAYSLATATNYIVALLQRGLSIKQAAGQICFSCSIGANFFMQIAKLRAIKPLWSKIIESFGGDEEDRRIFLHAKPARFFKTVYDPYVNMLRNTTELFSAVVGGIDSFENTVFDETIRKGNEFSRRIARNMQIMLQEEFGLCCPIDPAGGSWAIESLTRQIKEKIWTEFLSIDQKGGIVAALQADYPQQAIAEVLKKRFKNADYRKDRIVGNNMYPNLTEELLEKTDPAPEKNKIERLAELTSYCNDIDQDYKAKLLYQLQNSSNKELFAAAVAAASNGALLSELCEALAHRPAGASAPSIQPIAAHRWSEKYETLRQRTEQLRQDGRTIKIFLANMGPIPQHKARADFSTGFLQVAGFEVVSNDGFATVAEAVAAAKAAQPDAVVICSTDATYPEIVPQIAPLLKQELPQSVVYLAGAAPKDLEPTYRTAGIDEFISVRANCYQILKDLQDRKGISNDELQNT